MSKLLHANFARLWKSRIFWLCMAFMLGFGILASVTQYHEMLSDSGYDPHFDDVMFSNCIFMLFTAAVFVGLFIGTEYSDGTIRNKLIIGQTRGAVYFSNLIVCVTALLLMHMLNIVVIIAIDGPLVGNMENSVLALLQYGIFSVITVIALSALFLMMSMLIQNKANACVTVIVIAIVMFVCGMVIQSRLQEPEYFDAFDVSYTDAAGRTREEHTEREKNPNYIDGTKREIYTFLFDFLPSGQMVQIAGQNAERPERLPLYSLSIIVVTTACGVFFFRKKDLK